MQGMDTIQARESPLHLVFEPELDVKWVWAETKQITGIE